MFSNCIKTHWDHQSFYNKFYFLTKETTRNVSTLVVSVCVPYWSAVSRVHHYVTIILHYKCCCSTVIGTRSPNWIWVIYNKVWVTLKSQTSSDWFSMCRRMPNWLVSIAILNQVPIVLHSQIIFTVFRYQLFTQFKICITACSTGFSTSITTAITCKNFWCRYITLGYALWY